MSYFSELKVKHVDNKFIFYPVILTILASILCYHFLRPEAALLVIISLSLLIVLATILHVYRSLSSELEEERRHNQSLISIYHFLDIRSPLPSMVRWAAFPKFCETIIEFSQLLKPKVIVEAGSGVSTIISGYCLEKYSSAGQVLSLDHDQQFGSKTQHELLKHGLKEYGKVQHAPLVKHSIDGQDWMWYDLSNFDKSVKIDILSIDGPPVKTQPLSRYPALPLLYNYLSEKAVILLDDAARDSEQKVIAMWLEKYPEFSLRYEPSKKGIAILTRNLD
ncbi:MAG: class I SAM-dependent methyltransferase [Balneola sp.]